MNNLTKISVGLPNRLFDLGLTEAQVHGQVHRWCVISLFLEGKISATEAGELLTTDRDGFLSLLDSLGIMYREAAAADSPPRVAPPLAQLAEASRQIETLNRSLERTRTELFKARQQLNQADRVRSDFIATVSHELRTPLNAIIGFAKLLLNQQVGPLNPVQQTDLGYIYDSAQQLLNLVNNILDLSKIEAGKIGLEMSWVTVEEIVVGVMAATYILVEEKPIELQEEFEPGLPRVYADRLRIRQVVINLLSNAAKFTDAGKITLRVKRLHKNGQEVVCFSVVDSGIGIRAEDIDKVFEPFRQVDNSEARRAEGTGLGMAISYRLVKLHGGDMWVESRPGYGSAFSFTLPIQPPESVQNNTVHVDYRLS
ncbi:MAG: hypothetical protein Kow0031_25120 [Anaerolineae bacterium]